MRRFLSRLTMAALAAVMTVSCASGMDDVNRVQPNYYEKSQFEGNWYFRQTITDVPYEAYWIFEGYANDVAKIRWEIQEKFLIAYSISEPNPGANPVDPSGEPSYQAVATWPITSHFDIIREYNPSTGEQSNVIVENQSDRPWYERSHIRVDWSASRTPSDYTWDSFLTRLLMVGTAHWIQPHEETDPDAAEITPDYMSIVNAFDTSVPAGVCQYYFGDNPMVGWWGHGATEPCGPATVRVRSSFVKIDPNKENPYEPVNFLDRKGLLSYTDMNGDGVLDEHDIIGDVLSICADGYIEGNSFYCRSRTQVACTPTILNELAADPIHRIFNYTEDDCSPASEDYFNKFGYFRTEKIHYDRERGKTEAGREYLINRFNIWEKTTDDDGDFLPYAQREVKPVVYYLNATFPENLFDAAQVVAKQWDDAFKLTVAELQDKDISQVPTVYEVRPNSCSRANVTEYVNKRPEAKAIAKRVIGGINNLTMENLQPLCASLQHNLGFEWQKIGDLRYNFMYWVNNPSVRSPLGFGPSYKDPDTGEIISGNAFIYGAAVDKYASESTDLIELMTGRLSTRDLQYGKQIRDTVIRNAQKQESERHEQVSPHFFAEFDRRMVRSRDLPIDRTTRMISPEYMQHRIDRLKAMGVDESYLMTDGAQALLASGWNLDIVDGVPTNEGSQSFFDLLSPKSLKRHEDVITQKAEHYCMLDAEALDSSIIGLALDFDARGMDRDQIYQAIRERIFIGVMLHEVGHTIGLRHNFEGSMDGLNYHDDFWEFSKLSSDPNVAMSEADQETSARLQRCIDRAGAVGLPTPSTLDCLSANQLKQSSIMDYGANFTSDFAGLGKYDQAAVAFGYGGLIEVFENEQIVKEMEYDPDLTSLLVDYKRFPEVYGGEENFLNRRWYPFEDYQRYRAYRLMEGGMDLPRISETGCVANCDTFIDIEVPYKSCIDSYRGTLECNIWDEGGNHTEVMESKINRYENYYFLRAFRRGRTNWTPIGYLNSYFSDLLRGVRQFQYYYYYNSIWTRHGLDLDLVRDLQMSSVKTLNHISNIIQTPEPDFYCEHEDGILRIPELNADCVDEGNRFTMPLGLARPQWIEWSDDYPHYQVETFGTYYERMFAIQALIWSQSLFMRESGDPRTYKIGFNKAFHKELTHLIGSVATADVGEYGGFAERDSLTGAINFEPRRFVDPETFGRQDLPVETRQVISPAISFQGREIALLLGMAFMTSTEDAVPDFRDYFNIVAKGSQHDFDIPPGIDVTDDEQYREYINPFTGVTYRTFVNPRNPELSFGIKVLKEAEDFYNDKWIPADAAREAARVAWEDAGPGEEADTWAAYLAAEELWNDADLEMNSKLELIDRIRYWYAVTALGF